MQSVQVSCVFFLSLQFFFARGSTQKEKEATEKRGDIHWVDCTTVGDACVTQSPPPPIEIVECGQRGKFNGEQRARPGRYDSLTPFSNTAQANKWPEGDCQVEGLKKNNDDDNIS